MLREHRELPTELKRLCNEALRFALDYMAGTLSVSDEEAYGLRLAEVAGRILIHATVRAQLVVEGQLVVIDGTTGAVLLQPERRSLPPDGRQPTDGS